MESRVLVLCQTIPHLIRKITSTTLHPTKGSVLSSVLIQAVISTSHMQNHGLGYVNIKYPDGHDFAFKKWTYPPADLSNPSSRRFADEGGTDDAGNLIDFIRNDQGAAIQFEYFVPNYAQSLAQTGLSRLNQSIEAFVYCVLGAQVNVRSCILGDGGRAKEAQSEFLVLVEDAIRMPDISKSVQRFQLAIDEAKVRLDFATSPGSWLMPSRMVINTESTIGYNN